MILDVVCYLGYNFFVTSVRSLQYFEKKKIKKVRLVTMVNKATARDF